MNPKTWKKRDWSDQLQDPKELKNQEMSDAKKKSAALVSGNGPGYLFFKGYQWCQLALNLMDYSWYGMFIASHNSIFIINKNSG